MVPEQASAGSVLIATTQADDRRVLFDTLNAAAFDAVYTAKDLSQAQALLGHDPHIDVVVMEFLGEAAQAVAFCAKLRADPELARVPVIGIAAASLEQRQWDWRHSPPGVVDWLRSPVDSGEALARVRQAMASGPDGKAIARPHTSSDAQSYSFLFDSSPDEIVLSDPQTGLIVDVNKAFEKQSGYTRSRVVGQPLSGLDASHEAVEHRRLLEPVARTGSVEFPCEKRRINGESYPVRAHVHLAVRDDRMIYVTRFVPPGENELYRTALEVVLRAAESGSGEDGLKQTLSLLRDWLQLDFITLVASRPEAEIEAQPLLTWHRRALPDETPDPLKQSSLRRVLGGETIICASAAWSVNDSDRFLAAVRYETFIGLPLRDDRRGMLGAVLLGRREALAIGDAVESALRMIAARISMELELRRAREQSRTKSLQDALTGLPNRLVFNDRLETTIKAAHRTGEMFAVLFVDLDRFKNINDSLGHGVGDQVLVAVAKRLRSSVRASDTVARYAGDEFTMILRHIINRDDVTRIAEKILRTMETPLTLPDGDELHITASLGISFYPDDATNADRLLKHADVAMYNAKGAGRNRFQNYVAVPEESHRQRLALEAKLRVAEKNGELRVYYQPQLTTASEDIVGMEALIRWEHPELGMISPGFFIPIAEETGLIISIGEWVMRIACADAMRWQERFALNLRVGVNLSAVQLRQPGLVELVARVLQDSGLDANMLDLEVTESLNVKSIPGLLKTLQGLRDLGCGISIDDFGTGQSSLDYIKRFPADRIKIDQTFVRNIGVDPDDEAIVRATISMAHDLNRAVVAEGVEIEQHLEFLRQAGCEELQGYLFCRPLPASGFENLLIERERVFHGYVSAQSKPLAPRSGQSRT